jgi:prepilin-type processing-associated H-X9-DG protein
MRAEYAPSALVASGVSTGVISIAGIVMIGEEATGGGDLPPAKTKVADDGRFVFELSGGLPISLYSGIEVLTVRHGGRGNVNFCDGHAEAVKWKFCTDFLNILPFDP